MTQDISQISKQEALAIIQTLPPIDQVGTLERASALMARSFKGQVKLQAIDLAINMVDLTTLEGSDTLGTIKDLVSRATQPDNRTPECPSTAAICVYGDRVTAAREYLKQIPSSVKLAAVSTAFPSGRNSLKLKIQETLQILVAGADEIDMVIDRAAFLEGDYGKVYDEIKAVSLLTKEYNAKLKVIFETGELVTLDNINKAAYLAVFAGADFIKTSTGKVGVNATPANTLVLLRVAHQVYKTYGVKIGVKPAGGIKTTKEALGYLSMVNETNGAQWLNNELFRFGASSLLSDLILQRQKYYFKGYSSSNYVSGSSAGY